MVTEMMWSKLDYILLNANPINHLIRIRLTQKDKIIHSVNFFATVTVQFLFCQLVFNFNVSPFVIIFSLA